MARTPNDLPEATTVSEMYQAAILAELRTLRRLLDPQGLLQADNVRSSAGVVAPGLIELREPDKKVVVRKRGKR